MSVSSTSPVFFRRVPIRRTGSGGTRQAPRGLHCAWWSCRSVLNRNQRKQQAGQGHHAGAEAIEEEPALEVAVPGLHRGAGDKNCRHDLPYCRANDVGQRRQHVGNVMICEPGPRMHESANEYAAWASKD
eukprot:scaffold1315_cov405-Prasinococcus_capsulatus_cf.AAC.15